MKLKLTAAAVRDRCTPPDPGETNKAGKPVERRYYWDTDDKGFGVIASAQSKTFVVQRERAGKAHRVKIGNFPTWSVDEARKRAREIIVAIDKGQNPNEEKRAVAAQGTTLRQAIEWHVTSMKARRCAPLSMSTLRDSLARHLGDWLDRPLSSIRASECASRHQKIAGRYAANRVMQAFRACWRTAANRLDDLPPCPIRAVTFHKTVRRREPIELTELSKWARAVDAIQNPVRRDLQLFILLTGLRSTDARTVRWEHVDFEKGTIHRPKPKGGEERAFTVPVAGVVLDLLRRRKDENPVIYGDDRGWVFPSKNMQGQVTHVAQTKEQRYVGGKKTTTYPSPHRLRDTFATAAHSAGVDQLSLKVLMNHSLPGGDVTEGYIRPQDARLRDAAERIAALLVERMKAG